MQKRVGTKCKGMRWRLSADQSGLRAWARHSGIGNDPLNSKGFAQIILKFLHLRMGAIYVLHELTRTFFLGRQRQIDDGWGTTSTVIDICGMGVVNGDAPFIHIPRSNERLQFFDSHHNQTISQCISYAMYRYQVVCLNRHFIWLILLWIPSVCSIIASTWVISNKE